MVDVQERRYAAMVAAPLAGQTLAPAGAEFVIAEWLDEGGGFTPPLYIAPTHIHHDDDESWYVLEGTLTFRLDGHEVTAPAGSAVTVPRGVAHTWWNPQPVPARYLIIMTPRISELIEQIHLQSRDAASMRDLFRRYRSELVADPA